MPEGNPSFICFSASSAPGYIGSSLERKRLLLISMGSSLGKQMPAISASARVWTKMLFSTIRVVRHWCILTRKVVGAPSLEAFMVTRLWEPEELWVSLFFTGELDRVTFKGPFSSTILFFFDKENVALIVSRLLNSSFRVFTYNLLLLHTLKNLIWRYSTVYFFWFWSLLSVGYYPWPNIYKMYQRTYTYIMTGKEV